MNAIAITMIKMICSVGPFLNMLIIVEMEQINAMILMKVEIVVYMSMRMKAFRL
jgi:hypothetical protein